MPSDDLAAHMQARGAVPRKVLVGKKPREAARLAGVAMAQHGEIAGASSHARRVAEQFGLCPRGEGIVRAIVRRARQNEAERLEVSARRRRVEEDPALIARAMERSVAEEFRRAARVGAYEPDRGAAPVTIRAPLYNPETGTERMQRAAAYRQPMDHPEAPKIDRLFAGGYLSPRQYQNACAVLRLLRVVERSKGVAGYLREAGRDGSLSAGPQDAWNKLIEQGGVGMQAVCMLLREEALGPYMFGRATAHLDTLDRVALEWAGERWPEEGR